MRAEQHRQSNRGWKFYRAPQISPESGERWNSCQVIPMGRFEGGVKGDEGCPLIGDPGDQGDPAKPAGKGSLHGRHWEGWMASLVRSTGVDTVRERESRGCGVGASGHGSKTRESTETISALGAFGRVLLVKTRGGMAHFRPKTRRGFRAGL